MPVLGSGAVDYSDARRLAEAHAAADLDPTLAQETRLMTNKKLPLLGLILTVAFIVVIWLAVKLALSLAV